MKDGGIIRQKDPHVQMTLGGKAPPTAYIVLGWEQAILVQEPLGFGGCVSQQLAYPEGYRNGYHVGFKSTRVYGYSVSYSAANYTTSQPTLVHIFHKDKL